MANVLTEPADFSQEVVAYWINSPISDEVAQVIAEQQAALIERFDDAIWNVPHESLHISFNALSPFFLQMAFRVHLRRYHKNILKHWQSC